MILNYSRIYNDGAGICMMSNWRVGGQVRAQRQQVGKQIRRGLLASFASRYPKAQGDVY